MATEKTLKAPVDGPRTVDDLTMGERVNVVCAEGVVLRNNDTGGFFEGGVPTSQLVDVTLLRRLRDGDLALA